MELIDSMIALGLFGLALGVGFWGGLLQHTHTSAEQGGALGASSVGTTQLTNASVTRAKLNADALGLEEIVAPTAFPAANAITITNIPQTFVGLLLRVTSASTEINGSTLVVNLSTDNGATWINQSSNVLGTIFSGTAVIPQADSVVLCPGVTETAKFTTFALQLTGYQNGPFTMISRAGFFNDLTAFSGKSALLSSSPINAIQIKWDTTGIFDAGTYALYGVR